MGFTEMGDDTNGHRKGHLAKLTESQFVAVVAAAARSVAETKGIPLDEVLADPKSLLETANQIASSEGSLRKAVRASTVTSTRPKSRLYEGERRGDDNQPKHESVLRRVSWVR